MNRVTYFFFLILASVFDKGYSISCYNCMSKDNPACLNPNSHPELKPQECNLQLLNDLADQAKKIAQSFSNAFNIDLPSNKMDNLNVPVVCQKLETTVKNEKYVVRSCQLEKAGDLEYCEQLKTKVSGNSIINHCSLCNTDGCNAGNSLTSFPMIFMLIPLLGYTLWTMLRAV